MSGFLGVSLLKAKKLTSFADLFVIGSG